MTSDMTLVQLIKGLSAGICLQVHIGGMDAYADLRKRMSTRLSSAERGDPEATGEAILKVVDAEQPPLRFIFSATRAYPWRVPLMLTD